MTGRVEQVRLALAVRRLRRAGRPAPADRLAALRRHAVTHSPFYREHHAGLEGAPLADLPPVTKDDLVDRFDEIVVDREVHLSDVDEHLERATPGSPFRGRYRVGVTSGTSARPSVLLFDRHEWAALIANAAEGRSVTRGGGGAPPAGRVRSAKIGSPLGWHLSSQVGATLADPRAPMLRLSAATPLPELVTRLQEWQPQSLTAYPSILGLLAHEQVAGALAIDPGPVLAAAEPLTDDVRHRVREAWGVEVFDQYAVGEAGFLAVECPAHDGLHVLEDHALVEVVDDDGRPAAPGEEGTRVLLTALTGRTVPLIRYQIEDRLRVLDGACGCGRPGPRVVVGGRARDVLWFATDGGPVAVHPIVFTRVMDTVRVGRWQVVREADRIRVLVAGAGALEPEALTSAVRRSLGAVLTDPPPVSVEVVEAVPRTAGGKASLVIDRTVGG